MQHMHYNATGALQTFKKVQGSKLHWP